MRTAQESDRSQLQEKRADTLQSGSMLGQYQVIDIIGEGGFGCVYRARHVLMDRIVAVKIISPALVNSGNARKWFLREVRASTKMLHPNIVTAYDADEIDGMLFLAMEYIDGVNLDVFIRRHGPLPVALACEITRQAASALDHSHQERMVHRDVKPANLLIIERAVDERGAAGDVLLGQRKGQITVKLADFGLARLSENSNYPTIQVKHSKALVGTPHFVAPEQARNVHDADIRSDLYSLGCTLYYMLAGREPFQGSSALGIVTQHFERQAVPLETIRGDIPLAVAQLVRRLMAKHPKQRPQTPADLISELSSALIRSRSSAFVRRPAKAIVSTKDNSDNATVLSLPEIDSADEVHTSGRAGQFRNTQVSSMPDCDTDAAPNSRSMKKVEPSNSRNGAKVSSGDSNRDGDTTLLRVAWHEWRGIVQALVEGKNVSMSDAAYRMVHENLIKCIRACSSGSNDKNFQKLHATVAPWVSLRNFTTTDRATLMQLASLCKQFESQFGLGKRSNSLFRGIAVLVVALVAFAIVFWIMPMADTGNELSSLQSVTQFVNSNALAVLGILIPLAVLIASVVAAKLSGRR